MSESEQIVLYYVNGGVGEEEEQEEVEYMMEEEGREERQQEEEEGKVYQCQFCPSTFDRELGLYGHLNSHKVD